MTSSTGDGRPSNANQRPCFQKNHAATFATPIPHDAASVGMKILRKQYGLPLGRRLRRFRMLRQIKQQTLAGDLGVSQGLLSRWESGQHEPSPKMRARIERMLDQCERVGIDSSLRRLVQGARFPVHLICDDTHVLLAASLLREQEWGAPSAPFLGTSLWRFATHEIIQRELELPQLGWFEDQGPERVLVDTSGNGSRDMRILPSTLAWERVGLCAGKVGRLVTTVAYARSTNNSFVVEVSSVC